MPAYPTKNRGGRPRVDPARAASSPITAWVAPGDHDRVSQAAAREGKTISAYVRELVRLKIR